MVKFNWLDVRDTDHDMMLAAKSIPITWLKKNTSRRRNIVKM